MSRVGWREIAVPQVPGLEQDARAFKKRTGDGELTMIVGFEPGHGWHLSISHDRRYPTWDEIRDARYGFVPDAATMAMILPPQVEYVNVHARTFHLHEI